MAEAFAMASKAKKKAICVCMLAIKRWYVSSDLAIAETTSIARTRATANVNTKMCERRTCNTFGVALISDIRMCFRVDRSKRETGPLTNNAGHHRARAVDSRQVKTADRVLRVHAIVIWIEFREAAPCAIGDSRLLESGIALHIVANSG